MQHIITYPILFQAFVAVLLLFFWQKVKIQRWISIIGSAIAVIISFSLFFHVWENGIISIQMGNWAAPFGITLIADSLAVTMVVLASIVGFAVSLFSTRGIVASRIKFGYYPILHFMIMGLSGAFLTGDIFNLYVWFEVIIISSFVLLTIGGKKAQVEGAVKYFTLNMLASVVFLTAIALLYGTTGTLNMAELAQIIPLVENQGLIEIIAIIFLIAFGVKSGVFPLFTWLPAAYHTPPAAVSSLFGGLLTKLGIYAMLRVFTLLFSMSAFNFDWIIFIAVLTIISGAMGALVQKDLIKMFSYLIICHIGFMLSGLGMGSEIAITGAVFYMIHDIIVKSNLFLVGGILHRITGSTRIANMGGIMKDYPMLTLLFLIPLFSLVGVPPFSGFWPKISLISASLLTENYWVLGSIIFGSVITLVVVAKIILEVFAKNLPKRPALKSFKYFTDFSNLEKRVLIYPIVLLALISLVIGFGAEPIQQLSEKVAFELTHPEVYIETVFPKSK